MKRSSEEGPGPLSRPLKVWGRVGCGLRDCLSGGWRNWRVEDWTGAAMIKGVGFLLDYWVFLLGGR